MSLKPQGVSPIPETTARFAHAVYALGPIYTDEQFRAFFPHDGQPALSPGLLALGTVLQFARSASPTGKPLMQYALASTGNRRWRWNWMMRGLMHQCSASFAVV